MEYLEKWNQARTAIQEANSVDELSAIIDMAEAYRYALRQAKEGIEVVNQATEIKLRAERKAGTFLKEMPKAHNNGANQFQRASVVPSDRSSLSDLGITKDQSSQWQKVASIPDEKFESTINKIQRENEELSRAKLLKVAHEELSPRPNLQWENLRKPEPPEVINIPINFDDPVIEYLQFILETAIRYRKSGRLNEIVEFIQFIINKRNNEQTNQS